LGVFCERQGLEGYARKEFQKALELKPDFSEAEAALHNLVIGQKVKKVLDFAKMCLGKENFDLAIQELEKFCREYPQTAESEQARTMIEEAKKEKQKWQRKWLEEYQQRGDKILQPRWKLSEKTEYQRILELEQRALGEYKKALPYALEKEAVEKMKEKIGNTLTRIGNLYLWRFKDYPKAEDYYKQALIHQPKSFGIHYGLGAVYEALERYKEALDELRKAVQSTADPLQQQELFKAMDRVEKKSGEKERRQKK
jgi:tetratricopeptide (TPR) repeat protein